MAAPKIIFEDNWILVLDKPAGMTVNRADTTKGEITVQDWVEDYARGPAVHHLAGAPLVSPDGTERVRASEVSDSRHPSQEYFYKRAGIVHRLDKETSGVLIVAKTSEAFEDLQRQFKEREIKKTYIALVHGKVVPKEGEIHVPVGRLPWNRKRFGIVAEGRESKTNYKVIGNYTLPLNSSSTLLAASAQGQNAALLELYPKTGRTHQIRVHLKYLNHPIISDELYGGRKQARDDRKVLPRMFLHAKAVSFIHPKTKMEVSYESSLPIKLQSFLSLCKSSD